MDKYNRFEIIFRILLFAFLTAVLIVETFQ